jgi:hypothetical protein
MMSDSSRLGGALQGNCRKQASALIDCLPGTPEEDVGATDDLIVSY